MHDNMLSDAVEQLLIDHATPVVTRTIERGGSPAPLWSAIQDSGFCDALVPEGRGGAGLGLRDSFPLFEACGRHALAVPFAQTIMARALLSEAGQEVPEGSIALATGRPPGVDVVCGASADWVLLQEGSTMHLLDAKAAGREALGYVAVDVRMTWPTGKRAEAKFEARHELRVIEAVVLAGQMSGAMRHVFKQSLDYANVRQQFGRSIGKFQAIQHQLALMAEHAVAARMAAGMACAIDSPWPQPLLAAVAKARTAEAVVPLASMAHAIHGAFGITEEYDLQLHTRRLHAWRIAAGSETYWQQRIGQAALQAPEPLPEFVRQQLAPTS